MRKIRKRVFAAVLAAVLLFTMPGMASYAEAEDAQAEDISESATVQAEDDAAEETGAETEAMQEPGAEDSDTDQPGTKEDETDQSETGDSETDQSETGEDDIEDTETDDKEPTEEETVPTQKEDVKECTCGTLCTQDSINGDCPVCGVEDADLSRCKGEKTEISSEKDSEYEDADTEECICGILCIEDSINGDCPICGAEDADLSRCKGEKTEAPKRTQESRAEEKIITVWEWIDPEEYLTDGVLALPGANRRNPAFLADVTALLPEKIRAEVATVNVTEDGEETETSSEALSEAEEMDITLTGWKCADYPEDGAYEGVYTFYASLPEGFVLAEDTAALRVKVELGGAKMLDGEVSAAYQEASWNGSAVTYSNQTAASCTPVAESTETVTWNTGWYVVNSSVTIEKPITVSGDVNLILADGCTLNAEQGILVTENNSLNIFAQSEGSGTLNATGLYDNSGMSDSASAGIGGGTTSATANSGAITIHGGVIKATGGNRGDAGNGYSAAGIGGGGSSTTGGVGEDITISGGHVAATGGIRGAGIGGGGAGNNKVSGNGTGITISGGEVTAVGGASAAGIGGGGGNSSSYNPITGGTGTDISISGGIVDAKSSTSGDHIGNGGNASGEAGVTRTAGIIFENGVGKVYGTVALDGEYTVKDGYTLTFAEGGKFDGNYAFYQNGSPIEMTTVKEQGVAGPATVRECTHPGDLQDNGNGTHGGDCPYCGTEFAEEPHTLGAGNVCEGCNTPLKVQVETGGGTAYYGDIDAAWEAVEGATSAEITLLDHVTTNYLWGPVSGQNITFNGGNFEYTSTQALLSVAGHLTVNSGTFIATGTAMFVYSGGTATLNGGTFTGGSNESAIRGQQAPVSEFLAEGCAYYRDGQPIAMTGQTTLTSTVTVQECEHTGVSKTSNDNGTHSLKCPYCGYNETPENCDYGTGYQHNDTNHWQTCAVCGYQKTEAHTLNFEQGDTVSGVTTNYERCDCGFFKAFTVTVTVPSDLTYGNTGGKRVTYTVNPAKSGDAEWDLVDMKENPLKMEDDTLPADLPEGDYRLWIYGSNDSKYVFVGTTIFTVSPATLTGDMVTLSPESVTYSGTEQKPTITVKQGDTMLAEGADYDVAYSNTDFTNAGTITVTITGKGNYTGTVKTTYTIKKAPLTITASDQTITYGGSITQGAGNVTVAGLCTGDVLEGITLTASTANVPGGNITPSAAGIKNSGGRDVTGNYEITYKDGGLTINKADAEITVGTDTYNKTFGGAAFTLDVTDNNTEADVQYEVTAGADVVSVSNGTVTIRNAGTAAITVSLPETANYNAVAGKTITVSVAKKGGYTVAEQNRSYLYSRKNTGSIDLAALLPKDCGTITYGTPAASGDVAYSAAPAVNGGILSYTLNSGNKNDEGTITVTVATRNYTDITVTVKVKLTDRIPVELKDSTEVLLMNNILTYGEALSKLVFNEVEFVGGDGNTVAGILAWKDAAAVLNAGTTGAVWVFTPADTAYMFVEGTAAVTVNRAVPAVPGTPALTDRVYNPSIPLGDDDLSSVTVTGVDGKALEGKWSWERAGIVPTVDNSGYAAVFAPEDTTNYGTLTRTVTVNVTKAVPYIAGLPAAAGITYGDTLDASALSGGTVLHGDGAGQAGSGDGSTESVAGAFTWKGPSTKPVAEYTVVFTPSDTVNYNSVETKVKLTVDKAQNAPNMPGRTMSVSNGIDKVGSVPLPAGWEWQASDKDKALEAGTAVSAVAVYTGADKGNYENETVTAAITRSSCDHVAGDVLYTGEGEKAPTCTEDGLGHKECTKCGSVMESGIVAGALKHTGGTATCSQRAVCTRCNQPYGGTDSSRHGGTEVRGFAAAACAAGGYTGDTWCKDCGARIRAGNVTPALGHDYTGRVTKEPTTESGGTRTYTCTRCGSQYTESMPRLPKETHGHSYTGSITKEPTCTDTGVRTYTCTCGDSYTETMAALGHHYLGSGTMKPTTAAEGVMTYTCDRCGHSYTRPIAKLPEDDAAKTGLPFIKGGDGKTGWDIIRAEEEQAKEGSVINVDMNGTTVVPGDIFDCIRGRDITVTFDMGGGIIWGVDGKGVTADRTGDIDFSVKTGVNAIPVDIVDNVTGEGYSIQLSLAHEGEFGFTAVLSINLGKENAGYTASLYYYNQGTGELEFIGSDIVAEDGTALLSFTHASDYVIAIDGDEEEESGGVTEDAQPQEADGNGTEVPESPKTMQEKKNVIWPVAAGIIALAGIVFAAVFAWKKKEENGPAKEDK